MRKLSLLLLALLFAYSSNAQCSAGFSTAMAPTNNALLHVSFTNTSTHTGTPPASSYTVYHMFWGDGNNNYVGSGTSYHDYAATGTYTGMLIMSIIDSNTSSSWCIDTAYNTITVSNTPCGTSVSSSVSSSNPQQVTVTANTPAGSTGMTYSWNWGDGSPTSTGSPATHTYNGGGYKTITLTATNTSSSCSYTNTYTITLANPINCTGLTADFTSSINGFGVTFFNTSPTASSTINSSSWSFGDTYGSTAYSPTHFYSASGTYNVVLVNTWLDSLTMQPQCVDTVVKQITIIGDEISGNIMLDTTDTIAAPQFKVWLITFDSATNILAAVDSMIVTGSSSSTPYSFSGHPTGTYRTKAKLLNGPTSGTGAIPTYHTSSLMWNSATLISHTSSTATTGQNIIMQYGTVTSGPGFIGGNVSAGANKGTKDVLPGITVLLLNNAGQPVASSITDANGNYSFSNLPPATYSVYPELLGFTTTPASISVVSGSTSFSGIDFERSMSKRSITPVTTGITDANAPLNFAIYPNPAKDKVMVSWNVTGTENATVTMTDITGKKVYQSTVTGANIVISTNSLQKGLYFITVSTNEQKTTQKLLVQ
ncbi:MAG: T9SS type A sorting domain-containing protein [Bacteroidetes bacterium]|nr:T9SS type A sorting domain-containing protein [Bacteroidota bacterium]